MKKIKLSLGSKTLRSIEFQVTTILHSLHAGAIEIRKIRPHRTALGNYIWITYRTSIDPERSFCRNFAMQRVGECCDVWLDSPSNDFMQIIDTDAA